MQFKNPLEAPNKKKFDLDSFHSKAKEATTKYRIQETNFIGRYSQEEVYKDIGTARTAEHNFRAKDTPEEAEAKKVSDIFEASILFNGINGESSCFGPDAITMMASKYDDYINGVDMIVEFPKNGEKSAYLGLAVDVTFSKNVAKKFDKILDQIYQGFLTEIKYLDPSILESSEKDTGQPEVIIGASKETVLEVAQMRLEGRFEELAKHPIQIMILLQIAKQLETFALHSDGLGDKKFASIFRSRLILIKRILAQKEDLVKKLGPTINDPIHHSIIGEMDKWQAALKVGKQRKAA